MYSGQHYLVSTLLTQKEQGEKAKKEKSEYYTKKTGGKSLSTLSMLSLTKPNLRTGLNSIAYGEIKDKEKVEKNKLFYLRHIIRSENDELNVFYTMIDDIKDLIIESFKKSYKEFFDKDVIKFYDIFQREDLKKLETFLTEYYNGQFISKNYKNEIKKLIESLKFLDAFNDIILLIFLIMNNVFGDKEIKLPDGSKYMVKDIKKKQIINLINDTDESNEVFKNNLTKINKEYLGDYSYALMNEKIKYINSQSMDDINNDMDIRRKIILYLINIEKFYESNDIKYKVVISKLKDLVYDPDRKTSRGSRTKSSSVTRRGSVGKTYKRKSITRRKCPKEPAKKFNIGKVKKGNDKKMWKVIKTLSGKRWIRN